ncbi:TPR-repeat-containing protein, putative component of Menaquinone-cytochrome C reductase [Weissella sp. DD23]|nr:TPR-repeat-containing protein, putative component of Menaquinone-cytochrome C reductase [Weissella sp. DD23]
MRTALADIAIDEDKTDEAIAYLAEISPESNAYIESLLVLADLYQSEGLNEAAEAKLREAYDLAPEESIIKFALAEFYFATGQYNTAIPFYRELLQAGERRFSGLDIASRIGVAYALVGNFKNALGYLEQIKTTDLTPDVRFQLGMTYAADPETADKAIDALEELQEIDPSYAGLYEPLGQLYEDTNDQEQALITYQAGIAVDAFNTTLYQRAAAVAQIQGEDEEADRIYREALENNPEDLTLTIGYSNLLVAMGDHVGNINLLNAFLGEDDSETDPQLYWNLAQSYTALEDFEMATKYWNAALPFFLDNINFLKPAYYYFREEGETALAEEALFNYTQLAPNDYEMAELYDQLKEDKGL